MLKNNKIENKKSTVFNDTVNLKVVAAIHVLIWIIYSVKNGILWYYLEPDSLGMIIKYKLYEFSVIGGISSCLVIFLFKLTIKLSRNNFHLLIGYLVSVYLSVSFYIIVTGISFSAIILEKTQFFALESYMKGFSFYLFLFILLNLPAYVIVLWEKYREQILANNFLILNQKRIEEEEKKELVDKVFLSKSHTPNYIDLSSIQYIQADAYISHVYTSNKKITLERSLKKWEEKLPGKRFSRIHKSTIVNNDSITKIEKLKNNTYQVYIKESDAVLSMSRRFGKNFISNPRFEHLF